MIPRLRLLVERLCEFAGRDELYAPCLRRACGPATGMLRTAAMRGESYAVFSVDDFPPEDREWMGSKRKHWFRWKETSVPYRRRARWLFKFSREGTGEDWAEKIACELAEALGLPHAVVELASFQGARGCMVKSVLQKEATEDLVHGNEFLSEGDPTYPRQERSPSAHTVSRVFESLDGGVILAPSTVPANVSLESAAEWFVGYLLLDALIGNTDRHHENWAIIKAREQPGTGPVARLAPTFDHGSSLGRELQDKRREHHLRWSGGVAEYAQSPRGRSGFFASQGDPETVPPIRAFELAAALRPDAALVFLRSLEGLADATMEGIVAQIPEPRMSELAKTFTTRLLQHNRRRLLEVKP